MNKVRLAQAILTAALLFVTCFAQAQSPLGEGGKQLNAGLGFSSWGIPVYLGMDFGVHENITVGGELGARQYGHSGYNHNILSVSGNVNYHFDNLLELPSEFNFYGGANVGFYMWNSPSGYGGDRASGLGLGLQLGGRYFFKERWGINLEFGGTHRFGGGKIGITRIL